MASIQKKGVVFLNQFPANHAFAQSQRINKQMKIKSIKVRKKDIQYKAVKNNDNGNEEGFGGECPEDSNPEFKSALQKLVIPVIEVMGLPKDYRDNMTITGFTMSYTEQDTPSMSIIFEKQIEKLGGKSKMFTCPFFRISKPADGESGDLEVEAKTAKMCHDAITEAKSYIAGNRAQLTMKAVTDALNATVDKGEDASLHLV